MYYKLWFIGVWCKTWQRVWLEIAFSIENFPWNGPNFADNLQFSDKWKHKAWFLWIDYELWVIATRM